MTVHRRSIYETDLEIDWNQMPVSQIEYLPQVYNFISPKVITQCPYPFPIFQGSYWTCNGIWDHFNRQHWVDSIRIL